jgi:hypothetical protein
MKVGIPNKVPAFAAYWDLERENGQPVSRSDGIEKAAPRLNAPEPSRRDDTGAAVV